VITVIRPQEGPQELFLSSPADIAIYGGAAGGGKTWSLLMEPLRNVISNPLFRTVFFRRTTVQVKNPGGLWDASMQLYNKAGGKPIPHLLEWKWPGGGSVKMAHLEHEKNVLDWQGSEVALFCYDELTHFTASMFWYIASRNRSMSGVRPYIRATCNPDPDSWVAEFIAWWIDQDTGLPIPERSGKLRWFVRINEVLTWADTREELIEQFPTSRPKSVTFIPAALTDNKALMEKDPDYIATLMGLPRVERERLLGGNWKVKPNNDSMFPQLSVPILDNWPEDIVDVCRRWDLAATKPSEVNPDPDATVGILMGRRKSNQVVILDMVWMREDANTVRKKILETAQADKKLKIRRPPKIVLPQDPGQAGKDQIASYSKAMIGFNVKGVRETGDKEVRAEPLSAAWHAGNVSVLRGGWNQRFFAEMSSFPSKAHDDIVDAASGAFLELTGHLSALERFKALAA
jgi:predicted phage terminase large subunit-like protein